MFSKKKNILVLLAFIIVWLSTTAQEQWPSAELEQMYHNGLNYEAMGNMNDAIKTFRQAILLAPDNILLYKELAITLYRSGDFVQAEQTLTGIINKPGADTACYRILAAAQLAQKKPKQAISCLRKGLSLFPASAVLYHQLGLAYKEQGNTDKAIAQWAAGTKKDPLYAPCYLELANTAFASGQIYVGLLNAEMYLNLQHDTAGNAALKNKLYANYKLFFNNIGQTAAAGKEQTDDITAATAKIYMQLTPVISDGITTENLIMVRTRFLMEWFKILHVSFAYPLYAYLNNMISNGRFEIYNEWLFGEAENTEEFMAWNKFHEGDISRFEAWHEKNRFVPGIQIGKAQ